MFAAGRRDEGKEKEGERNLIVDLKGRAKGSMRGIKLLATWVDCNDRGRTK